MYYTVAYPKKFKGVGGGGGGGGGGGKSTHSSSLETIFFLRETIFVMWEPFGYFLYYAIMGTMRDLFLHVCGGGGGFLVLSGDLFGFAPPPPATAQGERNFRAPKIIKIYLLILKCRIIGLNIFLIFNF